MQPRELEQVFHGPKAGKEDRWTISCVKVIFTKKDNGNKQTQEGATVVHCPPTSAHCVHLYKCSLVDAVEHASLAVLMHVYSVALACWRVGQLCALAMAALLQVLAVHQLV